MKKTLFIFFLQLFVFNIFSQEGYRSGYVITYNGDTIKGKIKDRKFVNNPVGWQKIDFINSSNGEKDKYTADDIKEYYKMGTARYRSLALGVEEKKRFAEMLESSAIILFSYSLGLSQNSPFQYFLQKEKDVNSLMEWREADYKKTAAFFFKDDKELVKSIENEKLKYEDIQNIVKTYNDWKFRQ